MDYAALAAQLAETERFIAAARTNGTRQEIIDAADWVRQDLQTIVKTGDGVSSVIWTGLHESMAKLKKLLAA